MSDKIEPVFRETESPHAPSDEGAEDRERARGTTTTTTKKIEEETIETRWIVYQPAECLGRRRCLYFCILLLLLIAAILGLTFGIRHLRDDDDEEVKPRGGVSGGADGAIDPDFVNQVCSLKSLQENSSPCAEACESYTGCCNPFEPALDGARRDSSCFLDNMAGCVAFSRCQALDETQDPAPDGLREDCTFTAATDSVQRGRCEGACAAVECCWADQDSCLANDFPVCMDYAACQNLRPDARVPVAPSNIHELCADPTSEDCRRACAPAACCTQDCLQNDFIACLTYAACGELEFLPPINSKALEPRIDPDRICRSDTFQGALGFEGCTAACSRGSCCFDEDDNCFYQDPLGCVEYDRCQMLNLVNL